MPIEQRPDDSGELRALAIEFAMISMVGRVLKIHPVTLAPVIQFDPRIESFFVAQARVSREPDGFTDVAISDMCRFDDEPLPVIFYQAIMPYTFTPSIVCDVMTAGFIDAVFPVIRMPEGYRTIPVGEKQVRVYTP